MPYRFMCNGVEQTSEQRCEIRKADLHNLVRSKNASKRTNAFSKNRGHLSDNQGFRPLPHLGIKNGIEEMISRAKKALMVLISIGEARVTFNWRICMHGTVKESGTA